MKKTLVLASLLAAFGAASAQSSVTIAGWVDASLSNGKTTTFASATAAGAGVAQTRLDSGNVNGSRFTVRGTESLGGGLNGVFHIETGFNVDTARNRGNANNASPFGLGDRQAFVALQSAGAGTLALGRQYSSYDSVRGGLSAMGHSSYDPMLQVWNGTVATGPLKGANAGYVGRVDNAIQYNSPNISGFSAGVTLGLGEDKSTVSSASSNTSFNLRYAAGPIAVGLAVQKEKTAGTAAVAAVAASTYSLGSAAVAAVPGSTLSHTVLAGSYNFGVAKLTLGMNNTKSNVAGSKAEKEVVAGVNVPFGAASLDLSYATSKQENAYKADGFGAHVNYSLSPRTHAYVGLFNTKTKTNMAAGNFTAQKTALTSVGVRHTF